MPGVIALPEVMTSAATDLAAIGSNVNAAHLVAAAPITAVIPAAADEVSGAVAHLFSSHAQQFQAAAGQAVAFNDQFVQHLSAGAFSYASAEATAASTLGTAVRNFFTNTLQAVSVVLALPFAFLALSLIIGLLLLASFLGTHPVFLANLDLLLSLIFGG